MSLERSHASTYSTYSNLDQSLSSTDQSHASTLQQSPQTIRNDEGVLDFNKWFSEHEEEPELHSESKHELKLWNRAQSKRKRKAYEESSTLSSKRPNSSTHTNSEQSHPVHESNNTNHKYPPGSSDDWRDNLKKELAHRENIVMETDHVTVLKDKYPKAKYHYLVVHPTIESMLDLRREDISLLEHMMTVGEQLQEGTGLSFRMGFHALAKHSLLHMHVISEDFDGVYMKTKKHWNSFTSEYMRPVEKVMEELKVCGRITIDKSYYQEMLGMELSCHDCSSQSHFPHLRAIKEHVKMKHLAEYFR